MFPTFPYPSSHLAIRLMIKGKSHTEKKQLEKSIYELIFEKVPTTNSRATFHPLFKSLYELQVVWLPSSEHPFSSLRADLTSLLSWSTTSCFFQDFWTIPCSLSLRRMWLAPLVIWRKCGSKFWTSYAYRGYRSILTNSNERKSVIHQCCQIQGSSWRNSLLPG